MTNNLRGQLLTPAISLFTSSATLVCCALPALMVSLGMGAVLAGLVSEFPQLVWLSKHKIAVFGLAAVLLLLAGGMLWRARSLPCPVDPVQAKSCTRLRIISWVIYWVSVLIFGTGVFFAFIAPLVLEK
ncbi:MAG: hypothetical protein GC136_09485 [Alphaproteobacteria bacterium]|nr:hypothetical protein [Alphaproteobacteria bacterium]